jgi:uncharacterized protein (TIGR02996 family)
VSTSPRVIALALARLPDHEAALELLLEGWRLWRTPRLARVTEVVSDRLVVTLGTVPGLSHADREREWRPLAQTPSPRNLGRLLPGIGGASAEIARRNLLMLASWPEDPRLTGKLHQLLRRPRVSSGKSQPLWTLAFNVLDAVPDPRTVPVLNDFIRSPLRFAESLRAPLIARARKTIVRVQAAISAIPALPLEEAAALSQLETALGMPAGWDLEGVSTAAMEQLRMAIYFEPDDDAPRQVYADALQAVGDPRGELIALQLARGAAGSVSQREAELLREHAVEWSGVFEPCCREVQFERGFPSALTLRRPRWYTQRAISAAEWSTVEVLDVGELVDDEACVHELLWKGRFPVLREVRGISAGFVPQLRALRPDVALVTVGGQRIEPAAPRPSRRS